MDAIHPTPAPAAAATARLTRALAALLAAVALACQVPRLRKPLLANFALAPVATLGQSKLWNVLTAGFVDARPASALPNLALLLVMGRWVEAAWRARALLAYLLAVNFAAGLFTYCAMFVAYVATRHAPYFFTPIATTGGIASAVLVAIKQLVPEHQLGVSPFLLQATHLPMLHLSLSAAASAAGLQPVGNAVFVCGALHASWLYLRHYARADSGGGGGGGGDGSDAFAYHTLYPGALQPGARVVAAGLYGLSAFMRRGAHTDAPPKEVALPNGKVVELGADEAKPSAIDTERRRLRALKVLDERLSANAGAGAEGGDGAEGGGDGPGSAV